MARARNIKPSLFTNEVLGTLDPLITILFTGLWCLADRDGILEDRPLRIKAEIFPYRDNIDVNGYLTVLEQNKFVRRYFVDGKKYIFIKEFKKHQKPHHTERAKGFPQPPEENGEQPLTPLSNGEYQVPERSDSLIPDSLIHKPLSSSLRSEDAPPKPSAKKTTFNVWIKGVRERNEKAISTYAPVWTLADKLGLPREWIEIAWIKFSDRYGKDPNHVRKQYTDWRRAFRNAVEDNWFKLWYPKDGGFVLTAAGVQADMATREAA